MGLPVFSILPTIRTEPHGRIGGLGVTRQSGPQKRQLLSAGLCGWVILPLVPALGPRLLLPVREAMPRQLQLQVRPAQQPRTFQYSTG